MSSKNADERENKQADIEPFLSPSFTPGDSVVDRESDDATPSVGTVLTVVDERADEFVIEALRGAPTVAEFNPDYPAYDPVVTITFDGETEYNYPSSRLRRATVAEVARA